MERIVYLKRFSVEEHRVAGWFVYPSVFERLVEVFWIWLMMISMAW